MGWLFCFTGHEFSARALPQTDRAFFKISFRPIFNAVVSKKYFLTGISGIRIFVMVIRGIRREKV
jgi:hypothetical protein